MKRNICVAMGCFSKTNIIKTRPVVDRFHDCCTQKVYRKSDIYLWGKVPHLILRKDLGLKGVRDS